MAKPRERKKFPGKKVSSRTVDQRIAIAFPVPKECQPYTARGFVQHHHFIDIEVEETVFLELFFRRRINFTITSDVDPYSFEEDNALWIIKMKPESGTLAHQFGFEFPLADGAAVPLFTGTIEFQAVKTNEGFFRLFITIFVKYDTESQSRRAIFEHIASIKSRIASVDGLNIRNKDRDDIEKIITKGAKMLTNDPAEFSSADEKAISSSPNVLERILATLERMEERMALPEQTRGVVPPDREYEAKDLLSLVDPDLLDDFSDG